MGGGGFSMEPDNLLLDHYVLSLTGKAKPRVCFLPTASGDSQQYVYRFHKSIKRLTRHTSALRLSPPDKPDIRRHLLSQDVIYVGGGNTMRMLQTWTQYGIDTILREAYEAGIVLAGISAGSICWFEWALTDSIPGKLSVMSCLGMLRGSNCVHYDGEAERRPSYQKEIAAGRSAGIAADDGVGLHYLDGALHRVVSSRPNARAWRVEPQSLGVARETELVPDYLGTAFASTPFALRLPLLRRAVASDAPGIHAAHDRSIREIAARDYSAEQVAAWTGRPFDDQKAADLVWQIRNERLWVVELAGRIEGFAHLRLGAGGAPAAYLHALYLTPVVSGRGLARRLMMLAEEETRRVGITRIDLHSSRTARGFYATLGYQQVGPPQEHVVQGVGLPCVPMSKTLVSLDHDA